VRDDIPDDDVAKAGGRVPRTDHLPSLPNPLTSTWSMRTDASFTFPGRSA
jgi:hypothetical protein